MPTAVRHRVETAELPKAPQVRPVVRASVHLALVLASAVAYGWCFPPRPVRSLAWVALAPLFVVIRDVATPRAVLLTWLWTLTMAYTVNDWFPRAVSGYFAQPAWLGIGLFLGVATFTAAVQYVAFAVVYRRLGRLGSVASACLGTAAWVGADLARVRLFGGDPWAVLGYSQVGVPLLMQVADATGVYGITFVVVAVNAAIAELYWARRTRGDYGGALASGAVALTVVAATVLYGMVRLSTRPDAAAQRTPVGIVQENLPLGAQWRRELYGRNLDAYLRATDRVLRAQAPRLIVWPESSMTFFLADEPAYRRSIGSVLQHYGAQLLAGGPYTTGENESRYFNAAFLLTPDSEIRGRYDKRDLLPFAEFFPFGQVDVLRRNFGRVREFTPGEERPLLDTVLGPTGVIICNEGFFPEPAADRVQAGATVLVNLANDSWLGDAKFSEPAFDMVTLRAVEQRRWLIRASTSGPSAFVDPWGRVAARSDLFTEATLTGTVEPRDTLTIYHRFGDAFAWACAAAALIACGLVGPQGQPDHRRSDLPPPV